MEYYSFVKKLFFGIINIFNKTCNPVDPDLLIDCCKRVVTVLKNQDRPEFHELISKLNWCIGSCIYNRDPVGLMEYAEKSLKILKKNSFDKLVAKDLKRCLKGKKL